MPRLALLCVTLAACSSSIPTFTETVDLAGTADQSAPRDLAAPDLATPDLAMPDLATPDLATPDLATPDLATPDLATPDLATPDQAMPDQAMPDLATPDLAPPPDLSPYPDLAPYPDLTAPTCTDGIKNGLETGVDCGGPTCPACANGQMCNSGTDCTSNVCTGGVCQWCVAAGSTVAAAYYTGARLNGGSNHERAVFDAPAAFTYWLLRRDHPSDWYDLEEIALSDATGTDLTTHQLGASFSAQSKGDMTTSGITYYIGSGSTIAWMFDGNTSQFYDDQYSTWHELMFAFATPHRVHAVDEYVDNLQATTVLSLYASNDGVHWYPIPAIVDGSDVNVSSIQSFPIPWGAANTWWLQSSAKGTCP